MRSNFDLSLSRRHMLFVLLRTLIAPWPILLLPLPPLLMTLCALLQLLRQARRLHATRGLYEQLAAMQMRQYQ
jgi:hypothetical protein